MTAPVRWLNASLTKVFDLAFLPFRRLDPFWALLIASLAAGVLMLWIFGKVSDQEAIRRVRDRIRGNLLGVRIFGDDLVLLFRLQGRILKDTALYLRHALVPLLVTLVPVVAVLVQVNLRFAARPLEPGERATVKATFRAGSDLRGASLEASEGVVVETPGVAAAELSEVVWRVRAERPGRHALVVRGAGSSVAKEIVVGGGWGRVSVLRTGRGILEMLVHPGEPPIGPGEAVRAVEVAYPPLGISALGFGVDWLVLFLVASVASGFLFKRPLGVEF